MNAEALERRLRLGEDAVTEFKSVVRSSYEADADDLAKAICAMANTKGGLLLVGVEDDGDVTGLGSPKQADKVMLKVSEACSNIVQPSIICAIEKVELRGQIILAVEVPAFSANRPYSIRGKFYVRDASKSRDARREELIRLIQSADYHFDEQPVSDATLAELDESAVRAFVSKAYEAGNPNRDWTRWLSSLKGVDRNGVPTVTGVLLFGREPQRWLPDARISVVVFPENEMGSEFVKKEIGGRLLDQVDAAVGFLQLHVSATSRIEGMERTEHKVPLRVLREVILNSVTHRDYRAASQTRVFVYPDRVEVLNPGDLLNQLTLESIKEGGLTQRRNPVLGSLLDRALRRESMGMGVPEIIQLMRKAEFPEPDFSIVGGHFKVVLRLVEAAGNG
ncbi:MAG TPA: RNA-binding domain-containing protein [Myxococcaceae bacterium]|nr:RNA-binding domain-containing protein [Myxococcaceae bacterium]